MGGTGGGGGGASGKVSYPDWLEEIVEDWVTGTSIISNMNSSISNAQAANPYAFKDAPDYTLFATKRSNDLQDDLDDLDAIFTSYSLALSRIPDNWNDVYDTILDHIKEKVSDEYVTEEIEALDSLLQDPLDTNLAILDRSSQLNGIWMTSAIALAKGKVVTEHDKVITLKGAELRNATFSINFQKSFEIAQAESQLRIQGLINQINTTLGRFNSQMDLRRLDHTAQVDEFNQDISLEHKDALWDVDALLKGSQIMSVLSGAAFAPDKPSALQSGLSGAATGAGVGAMVGSVVPGPGTAAGAGIGAVIGGLIGISGS